MSINLGRVVGRGYEVDREAIGRSQWEPGGARARSRALRRQRRALSVLRGPLRPLQARGRRVGVPALRLAEAAAAALALPDRRAPARRPGPANTAPGAGARGRAPAADARGR